MAQVRYEVLFLDELEYIKQTDVWAKDGSLSELLAALGRQIHRKTEIIDIRKIGELMEVE
ncbi:hypothetical protein [Bhargavaea ginsengi]|uniref:hypothetical protein n=1 Tax=Bhargavaea ginsengi TaxID=426757 RepID=UPI003C781719